MIPTSGVSTQKGAEYHERTLFCTADDERSNAFLPGMDSWPGGFGGLLCCAEIKTLCMGLPVPFARERLCALVFCAQIPEK